MEENIHHNYEAWETALSEIIQVPVTSAATHNTYFVRNEIGRGEFSRVFYCNDMWDNELAIKFLMPDVSTRDSFLERALSEAQCLWTVRHPHIVYVYDAFVVHGLICIVADYCHSTLDTLGDFAGFTPELWVRGVARGLLQGLHHMHTQALIHCDVHGGNIFMKYEPDEMDLQTLGSVRWKVGDLGLARPIGTVPPNGTFLNTIRPPEIISPDEFGPIDNRLDLYQTGIALFNFLTGNQFQFSIKERLLGAPRLKAIELSYEAPYFGAIARMLSRYSNNRPESALAAWCELREGFEHAGLAGIGSDDFELSEANAIL